LTSAVGIGSTFDTAEAIHHLSTYLYGFYNYALGYNARISLSKYVKEADALNAKNHPERVVGDRVNHIFTIS
jgi:hypothetical protein